MKRRQQGSCFVLAAVALVLVLAGCDTYGQDDTGDSGSPVGEMPDVGAAQTATTPPIDPTPERQDGSASQEFEPNDITRAESASPEVRAYCSGAASEAQEVGCLSHVDEGDIP